MGENSGVSKARQELEDLYLGIPDDSVDLTLRDLASFPQSETTTRKIEPIYEERPVGDVSNNKRLVNNVIDNFTFDQQSFDDQEKVSRNGSRANSRIYKETSEREGMRRPGIPHSNICALCTETIYIFRHRCLVCGRAYCRKCVGEGMGEMTEGRKCVPCLGRRFSQRYIQRVGQTGCCLSYPSSMKKQELKWAEKGPKMISEREHGRRSKSPAMSRNTTSRSQDSGSTVSPVMSRNTTTRSQDSRSTMSPVVSHASAPLMSNKSTRRSHAPR